MVATQPANVSRKTKDRKMPTIETLTSQFSTVCKFSFVVSPAATWTGIEGAIGTVSVTCASHMDAGFVTEFVRSNYEASILAHRNQLAKTTTLTVTFYA